MVFPNLIHASPVLLMHCECIFHFQLSIMLILASFPVCPTIQFLIAWSVVFFAYCKQSKTGQWDSLGTRLGLFWTWHACEC